MLQRTLEPEVMDTREEAVDYDSMDHSEVNRVFVDDLLATIDRFESGRLQGGPLQILDVGTGTAQIPIELCRREFDGRVTAIDLSQQMLNVGRRNVDNSGFADAIVLAKVDAKQMPFADASFDIVMSNSIVHHIPKPVFVLREMLRVLRDEGLLFVRDLMRPDDVAAVHSLVATYAADENDHQRQMFRDSLCAALTVDEVRQLLNDCGMSGDCVAGTSDRHWTIVGRQT